MVVLSSGVRRARVYLIISCVYDYIYTHVSYHFHVLFYSLDLQSLLEPTSCPRLRVGEGQEVGASRPYYPIPAGLFAFSMYALVVSTSLSLHAWF